MISIKSKGDKRVKADLIPLSLVAFGIVEIIHGITTILIGEFLMLDCYYRMYLQEGVVIRIVGHLAHDDGGLIIVDFEYNEFGCFAKFEFLEGFGAARINGNARARLQ